MARRKRKVEEQMDMLEEGGLLDEGNTVDPVSGNDVPPGSTQEEVRDDIPAQLSEGEFVFPADVVRYIGLENLMELRQKAKQGLAQMEAMGQMGNSDEATMSDTEPFEGDIDTLIDEFDPDNPDTFEFNVGGVVPGQLTSSQTTPMYQPPVTLPSFTSFVQQPALQAAQAVQPVVEQKEYIGPNGERITIQFVNGNPATPIPEGYKEYTDEMKQTEAMLQPTIVKPEVAPGPEGEARQEQKKGIKDIGMQLAGKDAYKTDKAYQKAIDDLMSFEGKLFGSVSLGALAGVPALGMGAMKSQEDTYQEKIDSYYKEVARIAAEKEPDRFTEAGLYSRLTNKEVPVIDIADKNTLRGFTDETKNTYVDSDGLIRDTSGLSDEAKEGLGIASSKEEQDRYTGDDVAQDFDGDGTVSDDMFGD